MDNLLHIFSGRHGAFIAWAFGSAAVMFGIELWLLRRRARRSAREPR